MELILLQKVKNLGNLGDKVRVKPGYGRNYLVPQGKAVAATEANLAEFEKRRSDYEAKANSVLGAAETRKRIEASIRKLADRLALRHHSTVELIDRMEAHGCVKRTRGREDRRQVLVSLQPRGEKLLERVVGQRIVELRSHGRALVESIGKLLEARPMAAQKKRRK